MPSITAEGLAFVVPGRPVPKARARKGRERRWYTPTRTRRYEETVAKIGGSARNAWEARHRAVWDLHRAYQLIVRAYFSDRRGRDPDNLAKTAMDALEGVLWDDDHQVHRVVIEVHRVQKREDERLEVVAMMG